MNDELERIWKEMLVSYGRYYPSICLNKLKRKPWKTPVMIVSQPRFEWHLLNEVRSVNS
jgi:hypothetical protein